MSILIGSNDNRKASLVDGELKQLNGTLRFPQYLTVTQAREVCALFDLDFEDTGKAVQILTINSVNGGIGVRTAQLAEWLHTQRMALLSGGVA
jgi:hypothetical protein